MQASDELVMREDGKVVMIVDTARLPKNPWGSVELGMALNMAEAVRSLVTEILDDHDVEKWRKNRLALDPIRGLWWWVSSHSGVV